MAKPPDLHDRGGSAAIKYFRAKRTPVRMGKMTLLLGWAYVGKASPGMLALRTPGWLAPYGARLVETGVDQTHTQ
ncbi:MAG: hypothetical protein GY873_16165 [Bosea sp.]|uniref:hypothetical protein n=1 Tax=Bosea sp. (in: a-proteobacteria) TaxID=1871050 RepID=UPI0023A437B2|nr:hypothetical protein [Bosea sp. (in: a-proteobacteria)]MCP4735721.1 hypothetical protein [Bosea sp. (in: a-proteobacteria)]